MKAVQELDYLVATIPNKEKRYLKITIRNELSQIAALITSIENCDEVNFFDNSQDVLLFSYNYEEHKVRAYIDRNLDKLGTHFADDTTILDLYNFWFSDTCNNLETFKATAEANNIIINFDRWNDYLMRQLDASN